MIFINIGKFNLILIFFIVFISIVTKNIVLEKNM